MLKKSLQKNSLSIVFILLFMIAIAGQFFAGQKEYNKERQEKGQVL
jgi:hypothetical protein